MKYSIRGTLKVTDGPEIVSIINKYTLWRLVTSSTDQFIFEVWVDAETAKDSLFTELQPLVDSYTGSIDWHICMHDEVISQPCVIVETYPRG